MKLPLAISISLLATLFAVVPFLPAVGVLMRPVTSLSSSSTSNLADSVDPFLGTAIEQGALYGGGNTFPGADVPFGMVQWSPDTVSFVDGGYWYPDHRIKGFSLTHLSGAGCSAYGDIPFMPYVGTVIDSPATDPMRYISTFSHANEGASASFYQVKLDNGVNTELTVTQRSGAGRFTYPAHQTATMLVNISGSANGVEDAQGNAGGNTISGWVSSGHLCRRGDIYRIYFWAQFSQPFATIGTWHNGSVTLGSTSVQGDSQVAAAVGQVMAAQAQLQLAQTVTAQMRATAMQHPDTSVSGPGSGVFVTFDTSQSTVISVRVGISFVSIANARANVDQENPSGQFAQIHEQAMHMWNSWLGEIQIRGDTSEQATTFYTALYHVLLHPNVFSDVNGQYIGFDRRIHAVAKDHAQYANYSGWDIYRSEAQLLALLAPAQASDIAQSMLNDYAQSGRLPKWTLANAETYLMVGDPADPILADIYAFGGRHFDTRAALMAMLQEATQANDIRPGLNYLEKLGYDPLDGTYGCCNFYGAAATTLEYNTADFALAAFAQALGETDNCQKFITRSQDWKNLLNPTDRYLEPRYLDGSFPSPYDPISGNGWVAGQRLSQHSRTFPYCRAGGGPAQSRLA